MPEALVTADGQLVEAEPDQAAQDQFDKAMAADPPAGEGKPDYPAPRKRRDPDAPFGYEPDGATPKAPYGIGANGKPRQNLPGPGRGGKTAKGADKARTQTAVKAVAPQLPGADYSAELAEFSEGLWMVLAGIPVSAKMDSLKVRVRAQAAVLKENGPALIRAANLGAQHNATVRAGVIALTGGSASWVLPAMFMITPFVAQSAQLWRGKDISDEIRQIAVQTEAEWKAFSEDQLKLMARGAQELVSQQLEGQAA